MGNNSTKQTSTNRPKKNVHWKSAEIPSPPGKPFLVPNIDAPPDVLTLRWERPRDGGSPIYGFLVEHRRTGSPHWVRASPSLIPYTELALSGLEPGWRYQFRVTAENAVGASEPSELSDPVTVTLQRNAITPPRFVIEIHDTVAVENEKVEFRVHVVGTPPPILQWYKDGFEVFSSRRTKIVNENNTSVLIIHQAALTDEGEIKCSATNRAGHVITKAMLKLEAVPKIRIPRQYEEGLLIEADEVVRLKVGIAGRPSPMVVWCHNGEIIKNGGRYELVTNDKNSSLKIASAKRSDRGEYNLRAINKLGEDNVSFLVTVTDKPSPPGKVMISMSIGKSVSLQWSAPDDDGGCKIGNYIVEYFRVGWNVWLKAATTRQLNANLNDLIEGSEYKFRVKAESPYGMSDPSDESDVLFIPDPKRGINQPIAPVDEVPISEAPSKPRKRNPSPSIGDRKPTKVDKQEQTTRKVISFDVPPLPPKVKINTQIYDSGAIVREMNYGTSVEEKKNELVDQMYRTDENILKEMTFTGLNETYNPRGKLKQSVDDKTAAATKSILKKSEYENFRDGKSNGKTLNMHLNTPQDNHDEVHTSSEFVLVLYDDEKRNNQEKPTSFDLELDEAILPPPLSLSAPELGTEPPATPLLRRCVSSTELLYEKAMARFYQAVELEESESAKKRSASIEPVSLRSRLSSIGDSDRQSLDRHSLERRNSLKRKSAEKIGFGAVVKPQAKAEPQSESIETKKVEIHEKDVDETEDERDLKKEILDSQRKISLVRNLTPSSSVEYEDDYTDSTASSASLSSIDSLEKFKSTLLALNKPVLNPKQTEDNELDTYHPMMEPQTESSRKIIENPLTTVYDIHMRREEFSNDADVSQSIDDEELYDSDETDKKICPPPQPKPKEPRALSPYRIPEPDQSTIHLTKPLPLPSPDFVPKPILKTSSTENDAKEITKPPRDKEKKEKKERKGIMQLFSGKKAASSGSLSSPPEKLKTEKVEEKMSAAALAKKKSMEQRQSSIEETKVVIDHYSDIVKEMSVLKKPKVPLYMSAEELKKAAEQAEDEIQDVQKPNIDTATKPNIQIEKKDSFDRPPVARRSTSRESDSRSIFAIKLSKEPKKIVQRDDIIRPQLSTETDNATCSIQPDAVNSNATQLNLMPQESEPIPNKDDCKNTDAESRGRSTKVNKIPTKANSATRSRSSSALRNKAVQLKESDDKPLPSTRTSSKTRNRSESKTRNRSESKSPSVQNRTKLQQTSTIRITRVLIQDLDNKSPTPSVSPEPRSQTPEELMVEAEEKVKSTMNYVTDLALFVVACWVYIFKDAWMAVPILSLMVGRQVGSSLKDKFPKWMKRKSD